MTTLPYAQVIAEESARAADALDQASSDAVVPACPEWTTADLAYHLGEVQDCWAQLVERAPAGIDEIAPTPRRPDAELVPFLRARTAALLEALDRRGPEERCWSWSATGGTVAWVLRRQAHEALIHRVDAEQTAGLPVTESDPALAADGVDEMVSVMIGGLPAWGTFTRDGIAVRLAAPDRSWRLALGRFTGTSPTTGTSYDEEGVELTPDDDSETQAEITAPAWDLDLWLWGRRTDDAVTVTGDAALAARLRAIIVGNSQ